MEKDKVYEILSSSTEMLDAKAIVEKTGFDRKVVDKAITALKKEGKIESPKRCFYSAILVK